MNMTNTPMNILPDEFDRLDQESFNVDIREHTEHEYTKNIKEHKQDSEETNWWRDIDLGHYIEDLLK
jgi:hypothetical protein